MLNFSRAQTWTTSTYLEKHAPDVVSLAEIWDCSHSRFSFSRKLVCHVLDSARVNRSNIQNQPLQLAISIFHFGSWWARVWLSHISSEHVFRFRTWLISEMQWRADIKTFDEICTIVNPFIRKLFFYERKDLFLKKQMSPRGFGEKGIIGKISKGTRKHEPIFREPGKQDYRTKTWWADLLKVEQIRKICGNIEQFWKGAWILPTPPAPSDPQKLVPCGWEEKHENLSSNKL